MEPSVGAILRRRLLGSGYEPDDVTANLAPFIRSFAVDPHGGMLRERRKERLRDLALPPGGVGSRARRPHQLDMRIPRVSDCVGELKRVSSTSGLSVSER